LNHFFGEVEVPGANPRAEKRRADAFLFEKKMKKLDAPGRQHVFHSVGNAVMLEFNREKMVVAVMNRITPISFAKFVHLHAGQKIVDIHCDYDGRMMRLFHVALLSQPCSTFRLESFVLYSFSFNFHATLLTLVVMVAIVSI